jgi:N-acetylglucosamine kinase-like BadF-type ATPase
MRLFLGVDGGQSSTTALIADETGRVLGVGSGGPCNHVGASEGRAKLVAAVSECVGKACEQAGLDPSSVEYEAACFGMSGGPADKKSILSEILHTNELVVTHDGQIALAGAMAGGPGIIAIGGTGSIAFGRGNDGKFARAGGWGYIFGDEGGGFDLSRQALRAALRFEEGWGPETRLRQKLLEVTGARDVNEVLHWFYTTDYPRQKVATYSRIVTEAAKEGDSVASGILLKAARELALYAQAVHRQVFKSGEDARVAYIGGVFRSSLLLEHFRTAVEEIPGAKCVPPVYGPAAGALLEAFRVKGLRPALSNLPEFKH